MLENAGIFDQKMTNIFVVHCDLSMKTDTFLVDQNENIMR